jgi:uncharacterized protein (DUF1501 family)
MLPTTRRNFVSALSAASAAVGSGLVSLSPLAPRFVLESAAMGAERRGDSILVVVQLTGGNDGLNTIIPLADENYRRNRPSLAIAPSQALKIDREFGFHPSLGGFAKLLEAKQLGIFQGVGYPNPNRSHFESMDIWQAAHTKVDKQQGGWLGRALDSQKTALAKQSDTPALHLGEEPQPLALAARDVATPSIRSLERFKLETDNDPARRSMIASATQLPRESKNDLLKFVQTSAASALAASQRIEAAAKNYKTSVKYPATALAGKLKSVAQLIDAGLRTRVYYVALDGWDTHSNQAAAHAGLLQQLGDAVAAFTDDLTQQGHGERVLTLMFSEFGRRVKENGSRGTDHGAAAPVFIAGAKAKTGLIGKHPSLTDLDDGDLKHHTDFRALYAALLEDWLGWPAAPIVGDAFKPVPILA